MILHNDAHLQFQGEPVSVVASEIVSVPPIRRKFFNYDIFHTINLWNHFKYHVGFYNLI
jgi:hypothetical protein